eukprot:CAMPEP_0179291200 /NCGR_PEP_ID=MMETSP0797-20121207/42215_1 /TAXON_ID=47934 /ORGANISM="Dinophysis acuminata, Strain DAEP01" /LENGTH=492 /DNA_ID=CAMNT_0021000269 /DNA_START=36 /DNA_END=1511 /DNA_ORIENTATION=-
MPEYEAWKAQTENGRAGLQDQVLQGAGDQQLEGGEGVLQQDRGPQAGLQDDGFEDDRAIDLAFNKKRADDRKEWINGYEEGTLVDHTKAEVSYSDFINKELVLFAKANVIRAIPSLMDGFKPSQRKVLYGCFKRKLKADVKVAQLVGYVSEHAAYHHGEASLGETVVAMAQDFVGSNNINLLVPQGQFGTRLQGGKDSASTRYIYTRLDPITRSIFHPDDDPCLEYLNEEGMSIEPTWYCPVIPMVLINGIDGIGTGWSTSVPNFDPYGVIRNCRRYIKGEELEAMLPWYAGFRGTIEWGREEGKCDVAGVIEQTGESQATITELPVKKWTQDYREFLEENLPKGERKKEGAKLLDDYTEHHTEKHVHFELQLSQQQKKGELEKVFKLRSSISMNNMMLFDADGKMHKYESVTDIIKDYAQVRMTMYEKRKAYLLKKLTRECAVLSAKARFIKLVVARELAIKRRKIADLVQELRRRGFKAFNELEGEGPAA